MNIELKESLFRFIVPPCLFWGAWYFGIGDLYGTLSIWTAAILFVASGFVISALGEVVIETIDCLAGAKWSYPDGELEHWRNISNEKEYTQRKIEKVWNFYTVNINSTIALILFWALGNFLHLLWLDCLSVVLLLVLIAVFVSLAAISYRKIIKLACLLGKPSNGGRAN